jgi:cyclase
MTLDGEAMVKTTRFADPLYLGDPRNAVRVFNTKQVDELVILDITATRQDRGPDLDLVRELAGECFMPVAYGGGVTTVAEVEDLFRAGVEKVVINSASLRDPELLAKAAGEFGRQSVVAGIDVRRGRRRRLELVGPTSRGIRLPDPVAWAQEVAGLGAGEIFLTAVHRDGTAEGYDLDLVADVAGAVDVPVVACGGAGSTADLSAVLRAGAAGAAAGRLFTCHGKHRASLVSYPHPEEVEAL